MRKRGYHRYEGRLRLCARITGEGVTIAIVDTGTTVRPRVRGRISADSTAFAQKIARCRDLPRDDPVSNSTTGTARHQDRRRRRGARHGNGMHGVAYDATILALKISGPNLDGVSAGSTTDTRIGCAERRADRSGDQVRDRQGRLRDLHEHQRLGWRRADGR